MTPPPLLSERPRRAQILLAYLIPFAFGAVVGVALGISAGLYWGLSALAAVGGVLAGLEHETWQEGARRGLIAGALFALGILLLRAALDADDKVSLGEFPPALILIDAIIGMLLAIVGTRLRRRVG
jgi:hypothetical protein